MSAAVEKWREAKRKAIRYRIQWQFDQQSAANMNRAKYAEEAAWLALTPAEQDAHRAEKEGA